MGKYYNAIRSRNLYKPDSEKPFKLSRSKLELFIECPRCFYRDRRLGVGRPPGFPFNLNSAVDALLKQEFDKHREEGIKHALIIANNVDAIPAKHSELNKWRENFKGIEYLHVPTNLLLTGAIDDLWQNSRGEYIVVDYKSTSKNEPITELNASWHQSYKRQMEIYQWLLKQNGYPVSAMGYFVYCNGQKEDRLFNNKLEFDVTLIPHQGNTLWVEETIFAAFHCLNKNTLPASSRNCDYCAYVKAIWATEEKLI